MPQLSKAQWTALVAAVVSFIVAVSQIFIGVPV